MWEKDPNLFTRALRIADMYKRKECTIPYGPVGNLVLRWFPQLGWDWNNIKANPTNMMWNTLAASNPTLSKAVRRVICGGVSTAHPSIWKLPIATLSADTPSSTAVVTIACVAVAIVVRARAPGANASQG